MRYLLCCLLLLGSLSVTAQPEVPEFEADAFEATLLDALAEYEVDGAVVALVEGDEVVYLGGLGVAANGDPIDAAGIYNVGRLADTLIATTLYMQIERGRLLVDTPIQNILPNFRLATDTRVSLITPERLLNHTAGLGQAADLAPLQPIPVAEFESVPLEMYPGERFSYCTRCYGLLRHLLDFLVGDYNTFLQNEVFYPLRMDQTRVEDDQLLTTAADMAHLVSVFVQEGRWQDIQLIKPESITAMHRARLPTYRNMTENIGFSWFIHPGTDREQTDKVVSAYDVGGYRAAMTLIPGFRRGVLVITDQPNPNLEQILEVAVREFVGWSYPPYVPENIGMNAGLLVSDQPELHGEIALAVNEDVLEITYGEETVPATFVDERTLAFVTEGRPAQLFFLTGGRAAEAMLLVEGVSTRYYRRN